MPFEAFHNLRKTVSNIPSGNILGIFTVAGAVSLADLEHCANGASVLTGHSLQTDVVLATILGMGMTRERASVRDLTGSGASESVGNLCAQIFE